jgi:2-polyprenyl-6-methoxyphenol hydroxylase-like FAD-dependent oxidoreductase
MSTHFIQSPGMERLARWGLLDRLMATGCPPLTKITMSVNGTPMTMEGPQRPGLPGLASPRRTILDALLVDAAREAGAEIVEGVTVNSLIYEGDRVTGIEGYTNDGPFRAEARFVIGADGRNSTIAKAVGAEFRRHHQEKGCGYYAYFADVGYDPVFLHTADDTICVGFRTHEDLLTIAMMWPGRDMKEVRHDVDGAFMKSIDGLGEFGQAVRAGNRATKYVGLADLANFLRKAHGPGWALVGDAAYFKDPAPADGISDAFRGAEHLADALHDILDGDVSETEGLERYESLQDEYAIPLLDLTVEVAATETPAQTRLDKFIEIRMLNEQEADAVTARSVA